MKETVCLGCDLPNPEKNPLCFCDPSLSVPVSQIRVVGRLLMSARRAAKEAEK